MGHNIEYVNGIATIAFRGDRNSVWHKLGQQHQEGWTVQDWADNSGLNFEAIKVPAFAFIGDRYVRVDGTYHIARKDNGDLLSNRTVSDQYKPVQPAAMLDWFDRYIKVDPRFQLDVAGGLKGCRTIWATATFNGGMTVAGDKHVARLLMTTTFDGSGSTVNRGTMTRVVCNNTLDAAMSEPEKCMVRTRHSTNFDPAKVGAELAVIAQSFAQYAAIGDAMAVRHITNADRSKLFKACLDIPLDKKEDDVSTRKINQFGELAQCYKDTLAETNNEHSNTAWAALNAVTRYVDHNRGTRNAEGNETEARFMSSQFGSGAAMKQTAVQVLNEICDGDLLRAAAQKTSDAADVSAILKQAFRPSIEA